MAPLPVDSSGVQTPFLPPEGPYAAPYQAPGYPGTSVSPGIPGYPAVTGVPAYGQPLHSSGQPAGIAQTSGPYEQAVNRGAFYSPATAPVLVFCSHSISNQIMCPYCNVTVSPVAIKESGGCTFLTSFLMCFLGCWCISWLPFCTDFSKDLVLKCPRCGRQLERLRPA